jgi:hypothetical protein
MISVATSHAAYTVPASWAGHGCGVRVRKKNKGWGAVADLVSSSFREHHTTRSLAPCVVNGILFTDHGGHQGIYRCVVETAGGLIYMEGGLERLTLFPLCAGTCRTALAQSVPPLDGRARAREQ